MTKKDLFNEWERQEPLELDKEKLGTAFSKVLKKIDSVESVMENEKAHRKSGSYVFRKVAIYSSVAAAAVICVTLAFTSVSKKAYNRGLYAHIQEMPVNMTEYSTSNGEIRRVTLPDSSKVILNAGSVLICPERFGAGGREVYLSGEAVFDVTGDTGRAFVVKTSNLNVKVHGTRFNVSAYSDSRLVSATLCRGSISAMNNEGGAPVTLVPGQKYTLDKESGQASVTKVNADEDTAWLDGDLCFRSESLHNIVKTIERRYGVRV